MESVCSLTVWGKTWRRQSGSGFSKDSVKFMWMPQELANGWACFDNFVWVADDLRFISM